MDEAGIELALRSEIRRPRFMVLLLGALSFVALVAGLLGIILARQLTGVVRLRADSENLVLDRLLTK